MITSETNRFLPYIFITILLFLLIWFLTDQLNRAPLLTINGDTRLASGWTAVSDSNNQFTLNIPKEWPLDEGIDESYVGVNTAVFETGTLFAETDPNMMPHLILYSEELINNEPASTLVVFRSQRLNGLNTEELAQFASENENQFRLVSLLERSWQPSQVHFVTDNSNDTIRYVCEMRFAPGIEEASILVLCTNRGIYSSFRDEISIILNSFQEIN